MAEEVTALWQLVIAACALVGWWLALRPGATYPGAGRVISLMIVAIAVLLCILALQGQRGSRPDPSPIVTLNAQGPGASSPDHSTD
jgi:hypothetical protein